MEPSDGMLPFQLALRTGGEVLHLQGSVPAGDLRLADMLPMLQQLDELIVDAAARQVEAQGEKVSCGPGCGACCRQLVPISEAEAQRLAQVVRAMPPARRREIRRRFKAAVATLEKHGMLERLRSMGEVASLEELHELGIDYFRLGVPCPFLEQESCGIHPDRPLICREYIVTSPAANCAGLVPDTVVRVAIPTKLSSFLLTFSGGTRREAVRWMPLEAALLWADSHRRLPRFPGASLVEELVRHLAVR